MKKLFAADKLLVGTFAILLLVGLFFFLSASLGVLASNTTKFISILQTQLLLGFLGGIISFLIVIRIPSSFWQKYGSFFFFGGIILTSIVYIPGLGFAHGGATRWIDLGFISFQPADFLKAGTLIYLAALYSKFLQKKKDIKNNPNKNVTLFSLLVPALIILTLSGLVLLPQPDTKSLVLIFILTSVILFVVDLPYKIIFTLLGLFLIGVVILVLTKPYIASRVQTFINPENDPQGSSYQLKQSLIAVGSGGIIGQGFGQSIQKFNFLPEPQGDSIFAVVGEEMGFIGSFIIIGLYLVFFLRGIKLALSLNTSFARLFFIGFFSLFITQTFLNIGSSIGLIPLTGVPLPLMSQGGTSLLVTCSLFGIVIRLLYEEQKIKS